MSDIMAFGKGVEVIAHAERDGHKTMVNGTIVHNWVVPEAGMMVVELSEDAEYESTIPEDYMTAKVADDESWQMYLPLGEGGGPPDAPPGRRLCLRLPESDPEGDVFDVGEVDEIETPEHEESWEQHVEHMDEVDADE